MAVIVILNVHQGLDFRCIITKITKREAIRVMKIIDLIEKSKT